jgi:hypothetical protein
MLDATSTPESGTVMVPLDAHLAAALGCSECNSEPWAIEEHVNNAVAHWLASSQRSLPEDLLNLHQVLTITGDGTRAEKEFLFEFLNYAGGECFCAAGRCVGGTFTVEEARALVARAYLNFRLVPEFTARHLLTGPLSPSSPRLEK